MISSKSVCVGGCMEYLLRSQEMFGTKSGQMSSWGIGSLGISIDCYHIPH